MSTGQSLLEVRDLVVDYVMADRVVRAVDHVSFSVGRGEIVGLAGESGCGKSTAAHAIMRILRPPAEVSGGQILFAGQDILALRDRALRQFRWRHISIVFQSAMNSLNPVMRVGEQFLDTVQAHMPVKKQEALARARELLRMVGIDESRLKSYPHELSGGMRQRVVIAMALALQPEMIVMDEPTTALDVVVQREILQEIEGLQREFGFAVLFITHDLSLLVEFSSRIGIMYAGELVEMSPAEEIFRHPKHPYTVGLMESFPPLYGERRIIRGIPGSPPDLSKPPPGCRFHPRCSQCTPMKPALYALQTATKPELQFVGPGHSVACHLYGSETDTNAG